MSIPRPSRGTATAHAAHMDRIITAKIASVLTQLDVIKAAATAQSFSKDTANSTTPAASVAAAYAQQNPTVAAAGCCFLITGPSGSGKSSLAETVAKAVKESVLSVGAGVSGDSGSQPYSATGSPSSVGPLVTAPTPAEASAFSSVRVTTRSVDAARALRHVFADDSTMLHHEIFGHNNGGSSEGGGADPSLDSEIVVELPPPARRKTEGNGTDAAVPPSLCSHQLHINLVRWDDFELYFGKDGGAARRGATRNPQGSTAATEVATEGSSGIALYPEYGTVPEADDGGLFGVKHGGGNNSKKSQSAAATEEKRLGNIAIGSVNEVDDDEALKPKRGKVGGHKASSFSAAAAATEMPLVHPFAASPELLMHFMNLAARVGGKSLGFFPFEPLYFSSPSSPAALQRFGASRNANVNSDRDDSASSKVSSVPSSLTVSVTFLFAVANSEAQLDPIVADGPSFDYMCELLTPTEEERSAILLTTMNREGEGAKSDHKNDRNTIGSTNGGVYLAKRDEERSAAVGALRRHVASAAAAKLGGCSVEYVAFAGKFLSAHIGKSIAGSGGVSDNAHSLLIDSVGEYNYFVEQLVKAISSANAADTTPTAATAALSAAALLESSDPAALSSLNLLISADLAAFDAVWCGATTAVASSVSGSGDSADRRAQVGYTDVQKVLWSDIAGLADVKAQLQQLVRAVKRKDEYIAAGVEPSIGAILYGPPGTGKTMLAKAMATEMLASFVYLDLPELINGAIGESERVLKEFFSVAKERSPCIMFIDEIQSAFSKRYDAARGGNNSAHEARLVSALLGLLDEARRDFFTHPVVFIGATNWIEVIDEGILRPGRLDTHIYVGPPDDDARAALVRHYVTQQWAAWVPNAAVTTINEAGEEDKQAAVVGRVEAFVSALVDASKGLSGAEIKNGLNEFAMRLFIGDRFGVPTAEPSSSSSNVSFADFESLFEDANGATLRQAVRKGMSECCRKI